MRALIFYEFRKNFINFSIIIIILMFSFINILKIKTLYDNNGIFSKNKSIGWEKVYWNLYEEYEGEITVDKINKLLSIYSPLKEKTADATASTQYDPDSYTGNIYSDFHFFKDCFYEPMKYYYMYCNYAKEIVTKASDNVIFFSNKNSYQMIKNEKIANIFKGRIIKKYAYTEMYKYYFHYDFSKFLLILICLYALANVFVIEKETEMNFLLLTCVYGRKKTVRAKIIASIFFVCFINLYFLILNLCTFYFIFGSKDSLFSPIYIIENFSDTPLNLNIWQYILLSNVVELLGTIIISFFFLTLSNLFKNTLFPIVISLIIIFALVYVRGMFINSSYEIEKIINPIALIFNIELFRNTKFINIFGIPILTYKVALLNGLVVGGIIFSVLYYSIKKISKKAIC